MAEISISINSRAVHQMLDRSPAKVNRALRGGVEDGTTYLLALVKRYPPQRSGSTYRRTNTLMRSWSRVISGSGVTIRGVVGSSGNMAPYNRYVMSRVDQASVHRGRWATIEDIVERSEATIQRMFDARLQAEVR